MKLIRFLCALVMTLVVSSASVDAVLFAQSAAPMAKLVEDLRISAESENWGKVSWVEIGPKGQIVAPDAADLAYYVYDANGKRQAKFGRRGQGPGEWQSINSWGWRADTMYVCVLSMRRISYFTSSGNHLRTVNNPAATELRVVGAPQNRVIYTQFSHVLADGSLAGIISHVPPSLKGKKDSLERSFGAVNSKGEVRLFSPRTTVQGDPRFFVEVEDEMQQIPFVETPSRTFSTGFDLMLRTEQSYTTASSGVIKVTMMKVAGDTLYTTSIPFRGEPIPTAARDSAITATLKLVDERLRDRMRAGLVQKTPKMFHPSPYQVLGIDETVWVSLRPTKDGVPHHVLNRKGKLIATVVTPPRTRIWGASAKYVWAAQTDGDGLSDVVRYRVSGIACESPACR